MNRRTLLLTIGLISVVMSAVAQTVVWQIKPGEYQEILRIGDNLYKVVRNGRIGLIRADGTVLAPVENDHIGDFYERRALVTSNDAHGERVTGCLTDNGQYYAFSRKYYALNGQKFFSDDLLSVSDENGHLGYIDQRGNEVVGFDGKWSRIKPFTEGYAAVMKGKKYVLIDKDGNVVKFAYEKGVGAPIDGCTNVCNGIAYVYDEYGKHFIYDARTGSKLKATKQPKDRKTDYLYCYQFASGRTKDVPYVKMTIIPGMKGIEAINENGLYGYRTNGICVLPCQLQAADQFEDDYAVVSMNGQTGLLRYVDGNAFDASVISSTLSFKAGNAVACKFSLGTPSVWRDRSLEVHLKDDAGIAMELTNVADNYSFSYRPTATGQKRFRLEVFSEGLKLYENELAFSFSKIEPPPVSEGKKEELCPDCNKPISKCPKHGVH